MIDEIKYYSYINERFIKANEHKFRKAKDYLNKYTFANYDNCYDDIIEKLNDIEKKYEFNMQRMCRNNYQMLTIFQLECKGEINEESRKYALEFLIFCCFADKLLDSRRFDFEQKKQVSRLLGLYGVMEEDNKFYELKWFVEDVSKYITRYKNSEKRNYIEDLVNAAFISEVYMWKIPIEKKEKFLQKDGYLLLDKSIKFEEVALLLALGEDFEESDCKVANLIAKIMWLTDDLCDFTQDIKENRRNSLFYLNMPECELDMNKRGQYALYNMDNYVKMLEGYISELEYICKEPLYYYIVSLVEKWFSDIKIIAS